jgi:hypothetical protein
MEQLEGRAAEMVKRRCSTELAGGAMMGDGFEREERLEPG